MSLRGETRHPSTETQMIPPTPRGTCHQYLPLDLKLDIHLRDGWVGRREDSMSASDSALEVGGRAGTGGDDDFHFTLKLAN